MTMTIIDRSDSSRPRTAARGRRARLVSSALAALMLLSAGGPPASDVNPVRLLLVQSLDFGKILRDRQKSISFSSEAAARLEVTGHEKKKVLLEVRGATLRLNGNQIPFTIVPSDIAYSKDGVTWKNFTRVDLKEEVTLPNAPGSDKTSKIHLRIGGSIQTQDDQQRGAYVGAVTVSVGYVTD